MTVFDMHTHLYCLFPDEGIVVPEQDKMRIGEMELAFRERYGIASCISCGTPEEWQFMRRLCGDDVLLSFGIHPWHSNQYDPFHWLSFFAECDAVGEIGMDSVWCDIPLVIQKRMMEQQLQIAADLEKPVILHTKGQERAISELIRDFPGKICVHWYSGSVRDLEPYLEKDCYFTLGPDLGEACGNEVYEHILKHVPVERLFLESDGISSVIWARQEQEKKQAWDAEKAEQKFELLPEVFKRNLSAAARAKKISPKELEERMWWNRADFFMPEKDDMMFTSEKRTERRQ